MIQPGDVLGYYKANNAYDDLIQWAEYAEDGIRHPEYYHVAVALDAQRKIEAVEGGVRIDPIVQDGTFNTFRLPVAPTRVAPALAKLERLVGEHYDNWLIVDDALRYFSLGLTGSECIHLPTAFIRRKQRTEVICVSVLRRYCRYAGFKAPNWLTTWSSPEDWGTALEGWQVDS